MVGRTTYNIIDPDSLATTYVLLEAATKLDDANNESSTANLDQVTRLGVSGAWEVSLGFPHSPALVCNLPRESLEVYLIGLHSKEGRDAPVSEKLVIMPQAQSRCKRKKLSCGATPTSVHI